MKLEDIPIPPYSTNVDKTKKIPVEIHAGLFERLTELARASYRVYYILEGMKNEDSSTRRVVVSSLFKASVEAREHALRELFAVCESEKQESPKDFPEKVGRYPKKSELFTLTTKEKDNA